MTTTATTAFRVSPIDEGLVREVRETLHDRFGNTLHVRVSDDDGNPCRACLRLTPRGTRLILFAYQPSVCGGPYAEVGPVFVHADACAQYATPDAFPADFRSRSLAFRAYDQGGEIRTATLAAGTSAEATLAGLFADAAVARVDVRNPAWGFSTLPLRVVEALPV